ncbi:hypothetical protein M514_03880, partial [Trichuris suis]
WNRDLCSCYCGIFALQWHCIHIRCTANTYWKMLTTLCDGTSSCAVTMIPTFASQGFLPTTIPNQTMASSSFFHILYPTGDNSITS